MSAKRICENNLAYKVIKTEDKVHEAEMYGGDSSSGPSCRQDVTPPVPLRGGEAESSSCWIEEDNADEEYARDWLMDDWDNTEGYDSVSDEDDEIDVQQWLVEDVPFDEQIRNWALTTNVQPRTSLFSLNILINGLPLYKGTRKQYWPILMSIHEMPEVPVLMVGNFYGESKPLNAEQYLRPLVDELNGLMQNGIAIAKKLIEVRVRAFITNSPARAFVRGVTVTNCNQVCEKCVTEGKLPGGAHS
uniref:Uncharacterized protein n=1 Tax=Anopheles maculatus TaxID=74869 RepID=A0A182SQ90_9DIPT